MARIDYHGKKFPASRKNNNKEGGEGDAKEAMKKRKDSGRHF